jgi:hypothetical protein
MFMEAPMGDRHSLSIALATLASLAFAGCASSPTDAVDGASAGGTTGTATSGSSCIPFSGRIVNAIPSYCSTGSNVLLTCDAVPGSSLNASLDAGQRSIACCGLSSPYYCPQTASCYTTAAAAAAACGTTACSACVNMYGTCTQLCSSGHTLVASTCTCICTQTCSGGKYQDPSTCLCM